MFESTILDVSTIKVLDKYIQSKEQYFLITDDFNILCGDKIYNIYFVISNKIPVDKKIVKTNVTMTEFKKIYNSHFNSSERISDYKNTLSETDRTKVPKCSMPVFDFLEMFFEHFEKHNEEIHSEDDIIFFDNPISINAQSSNNRTGYGNEYYYDTLIYEGTKYGETSEFPIVGYQICKAGEVHNNSIRWTTQDGYIHIQSM
ncbi:hypothetical protein KQI85_15410 [Falcatimonas sp. MSJ-15]|uniref:hypothetical protein n=1 Tax=Falcatimonas sp. MSJ-15 TaxID=2841515 RepID=UPI001C11F31D|nr:hypothetical protein [Falcatimonas sp. MSJ-15]MBU5471723.1 hypothetical protein [Falcatimonas sp. MSJ-15]